MTQPPRTLLAWLPSWLLVALVACSPRGEVTDLDGAPVDPLAGLAPATVLVFVSTACPISNRYAPEIHRIYERFSPRGVAFYVVYPLAGETREAVRVHVREYGFSFGALRDPMHVLVRRAGVTATPEVAVFLAGGKLVYRGRIDDRQIDFGRTRAEPTRRDLEVALDEILAGHPVEERTTTSIGCAIPPP
jgi:hypothetical protein